MGYGGWSEKSYISYATDANLKSRDVLFHRKTATAPVRSGQDVNVKKIKYRESRDSEAHPCSTPIMVGLDVSGSMGVIPEYMVKHGLGVFVGQLLQRRPIPDPHLLFMAIGDAVAWDKQPLQSTQFETDNRICEQLTDLFLEGGGGNNDFESYDLAWAFAAYRTHTDAWDKRQAKGYLFTVGDECFPQSTSQDYLRKVFGNDCPQAPTPESLLAACQERYHTFHVIIEQGSYCRYQDCRDHAINSWRQRLQRRALVLREYRYLAELIVSTIAIDQGTAPGEVIEWWDETTARAIYKALDGTQKET